MDWIAYIVALFFCAVGAACVFSIVFSLPGAWIMLGIALLIELADPLYLTEPNQQTFAWWLLVVCAALAGLGELLEFAAGAAGAKGGGAGKRGIVGALIGGIAGALVLSIPVPIIGTLIGAAIGSFVGAVIGEMGGVAPKTFRGSMKPALGATIGRVAGTVGKIAVAIAIWITLSVAAFVP